MRLAATIRQRAPTFGVVLAVFLSALVPRLIGLGTFLTADEGTWVGRGVEFVRAGSEFRFNDTLLTTHPGIPTLWISGLTAAAVSAFREAPFHFDEIHRYVHMVRIVLALLHASLIAGIFLVLRRLCSRPVALLAGFLLALDPFLIAHGKVVHVDALLAEFAALSLLLFLVAEGRGSGVALVGSAVFASFAILSKIPGLVLLPSVALIAFARRGAGHAAERAGRLRVLGQWFVILVATTLVLWPGLLWVPDPVGNVLIVKRDLIVAVSTPHHMAEDYTLKLWHYPATILTRTTIPTLFGFLAFIVMLVNRALDRARRRDRDLDHRLAWILLGYLALFLAGMMLGAKKGDRYLLPVFPILDLLAAAGILAVIQTVRPHWTDRRRALAVFALVILPLLAGLVRLGPYALAHRNPLFPPNLSQELGWGEGLDQVARFLNDQNDHDQSVAASWYPEVLRSLVRRPVVHLNAHEQLRIGYVVLYRNMFGRPPDHPANDFLDAYYRQQDPVFVARVTGLPYAWVYRKPAYLEVVSELTPNLVLVAELPPPGSGQLTGVELFLATYSGRADRGEIHVRVRERLDGPDLRFGSLPIRAEDDNRWVRVPLNEPLAAPSTPLLAVVTTTGTASGRAPTIRFAPHERDAPWYALTSATRPGTLDRFRGRGLLGIRSTTIPLPSPP